MWIVRMLPQPARTSAVLRSAPYAPTLGAGLRVGSREGPRARHCGRRGVRLFVEGTSAAWAGVASLAMSPQPCGLGTDPGPARSTRTDPAHHRSLEGAGRHDRLDDRRPVGRGPL
jgi:hypothetical protein